MTKALEVRKKSEDPPGKLKEDLDQFFSLDRNKDGLISCKRASAPASRAWRSGRSRSFIPVLLTRVARHACSPPPPSLRVQMDVGGTQGRQGLVGVGVVVVVVNNHERTGLVVHESRRHLRVGTDNGTGVAVCLALGCRRDYGSGLRGWDGGPHLVEGHLASRIN